MLRGCKLKYGKSYRAVDMMQERKTLNGNLDHAAKIPFDLCDHAHSGILRGEGALSGQSSTMLEDCIRCRVLQRRLDHLGVHVSSTTCADVLYLHRKAKLPPYGKRIYDLIVERAENLEECLDSLLVQMCIETKALNDAHNIASKLPHVSILVWNCLIGAYAQQEKVVEALKVFETMQEKGVFPDNITFVNVCTACKNPVSLTKGRCLHFMIIFVGCKIDVVLETALLTMYSKCGSLEDTVKLFDSMETRNVVSWTVMIGANARNCQFADAFYLYDQMKQEGTLPNRVTYMCLLEACSCPKMLAKGKWLHSCSIKGLDYDIHMVTALVHMYGKCGSLRDAQDLFELLQERDVGMWNALMAVYVRHKRNSEAIQVFYSMLNEGVIPSLITYATIAASCVHNPLCIRKNMHTHVVCSGLQDNIVVTTALINMYGKSGRLNDALLLFDNMKEQNVVSWNTMIAVYAENRCLEDVLQLLDKMQHKGFWANNVTYVSALEACTDNKALPAGKRLHVHIAESGYKMDVIVATALASMYCKCGNLQDGYKVFNDMSERNVVSWNAMVSACSQCGRGMQGFSFYKQMQRAGVTPDQVTYTSVLSICANQLVFLTLGKHIHSHIMHSGCEPDIIVATSLLDMYGKCGSLQDACKVFDKMSKDSVVSWNVMISNYAQHGYAGEAISLVNVMQRGGVIPNSVTFVCVLSACSHAGMLIEGYYNALYMNIHGIGPRPEQFHCIIDLLGRAGRTEEAKDLVHKMPLEPSVIAWMTLLGSCRNTIDVERAEHIAKHIFEYDPGSSAALTLLASIHSAS